MITKDIWKILLCCIVYWLLLNFSYCKYLHWLDKKFISKLLKSLLSPRNHAQLACAGSARAPIGVHQVLNGLSGDAQQFILQWNSDNSNGWQELRVEYSNYQLMLALGPVDHALLIRLVHVNGLHACIQCWEIIEHHTVHILENIASNFSRFVVCFLFNSWIIKPGSRND